MLKLARLTLKPVKINYSTSPSRAKYNTHNQLRDSYPISNDMKEDVIKAYETFVSD